MTGSVTALRPAAASTWLNRRRDKVPLAMRSMNSDFFMMNNLPSFLWDLVPLLGRYCRLPPVASASRAGSGAVVWKWLKKAFQCAAAVGYSRNNKRGATKLRQGGRACMSDTDSGADDG
jgi:hypothetical protein